MVIALGESANIRVIEGIRTAMLEEFQTGADLELDVSQVADADVSFLQLVEASRKFAAAEGKRFRLTAPASAPLASLLERAGFLADDTSDGRAFWIEGDVR